MGVYVDGSKEIVSVGGECLGGGGGGRARVLETVGEL